MQKRTVTIDGVEKTFHEAHQDLWNELSQNPEMEKGAYFRKHEVQISKNRDWVRNNCFACECCNFDCEKCPITVWKSRIDCICASSKELYGKWDDCMEIGMYDEACKIAKQIADLEWEEVEE